MSAPPRPIEAKATVPLIGTSALLTLAAALFRVATAFGLEVTDAQRAALAGFAAAAAPFLSFVLAYLAPHTARPDLISED